MFALRKITGNGSELNFDLGDYYVLITKDVLTEEFEDKMKDILVMMRAYAFICWNDGCIYHYIKNNKILLFMKWIMYS